MSYQTRKHKYETDNAAATADNLFRAWYPLQRIKLVPVITGETFASSHKTDSRRHLDDNLRAVPYSGLPAQYQPLQDTDGHRHCGDGVRRRVHAHHQYLHPATGLQLDSVLGGSSMH